MEINEAFKIIEEQSKDLETILLSEDKIEKEIGYNSHVQDVVNQYQDYKSKPFFQRMYYNLTHLKEVSDLKTEYNWYYGNLPRAINNLNECSKSINTLSYQIFQIESILNKDYMHIKEESVIGLIEGINSLKRKRVIKAIEMSILGPRVFLFNQYSEPMHNCIPS